VASCAIGSRRMRRRRCSSATAVVAVERPEPSTGQPCSSHAGLCCSTPVSRTLPVTRSPAPERHDSSAGLAAVPCRASNRPGPSRCLPARSTTAVSSPLQPTSTVTVKPRGLRPPLLHHALADYRNDARVTRSASLFTERVLPPFDGPLFDGYRSNAPASARTEPPAFRT